MRKSEMMALILAGGEGSRLGTLTNYIPKPAMYYGGDHRIIDFPISNCINSGIKTIGILTQFHSDFLHKYIDSLNCVNRFPGVSVIKRSSDAYRTPYGSSADAILKNADFIESCSPKYILILPGDHICKMDYAPMLAMHKKHKAAVTIAAAPTDSSVVSDYGFLYSHSFPQSSASHFTSMGIFLFTWKDLKKYLIQDHSRNSEHDLGQSIIAAMMRAREVVCTYKYNNYWRDIDTVFDLYNANMDLIGYRPEFQIFDPTRQIYTSPQNMTSYYYPKHGNISNSLVSKNCNIYGTLMNSVVSNSVIIREGAEVSDSVIMPNAYIGSGVKVHRSIIGPNAKILSGIKIGMNTGTRYFMNKELCHNDVSLVAPYTYLSGETIFYMGSHIKSTVSMDTPVSPHIQKA